MMDAKFCEDISSNKKIFPNEQKNIWCFKIFTFNAEIMKVLKLSDNLPSQIFEVLNFFSELKSKKILLYDVLNKGTSIKAGLHWEGWVSRYFNHIINRHISQPVSGEPHTHTYLPIVMIVSHITAGWFSIVCGIGGMKITVFSVSYFCGNYRQPSLAKTWLWVCVHVAGIKFTIFVGRLCVCMCINCISALCI